jgi:hypothetical protein
MKYPISVNHKTIFVFADTYGNHRKATVPDDVDIIVFTGDACVAGNEMQLAISLYLSPIFFTSSVTCLANHFGCNTFTEAP